MEYPGIPFPGTIDQKVSAISFENKAKFNSKELEFDVLPWIVSPDNYLNMQNIDKESLSHNNSLIVTKLNNHSLNFKDVSTSVCPYTSGALVTKNKYLYGKFKVELRPSNVSGIITGVFLHRNSPH